MTKGVYGVFRKHYKDFSIVYPIYLELGLRSLEKETGLDRDKIFEKLGLKTMDKRYKHEER